MIAAQTLELLRRYQAAWRVAWQRRKALDTPERLRHEVQFLPAALALQEQPVHPAPRYTVWGLMSFAAVGLLWACIGEVDVVATARGKVVPSGKSKLIQPNEVAVVKAIHVQDGQAVKAGDLLVELHSHITAAEVSRLRSQLLAAQVDSARAKALLEAIETDAPPRISAQLNASERDGAQRWLDGQYTEYRSALDQVAAEIDKNTAEVRSARASVASLRLTLPIARQLAADYKILLEKAFVAKHAYLEKEQARLGQERELTTQELRVQELQAIKKAAGHRYQSVKAQTRKAMLDLHNDADQKAASLAQELLKAEQRHRLRKLSAPVDGTVQQLAIHTPGGVVTPAQSLMVIVPRDQPLEVEVLLENKDIGFVRAGQPVEVKVETFTFTKYGVIAATVTSVSNDAIEDERLGLVYSARLKLGESHIRVGSRDLPLSPGMAVRAEIITDRRTVISYFLSPLKAYVDEGLRER
ncbi:HlyD family type I secretion periplasmic adaptor subunit [Pseudomonas abieticivorans]|uniref:HlyD family type I secretion periplasmic adaptor subunit n=1 Tax=Pseudomonas abieticivorans TaxID=2931382 RepID=UPI0020BE56CA|nr:HlyD family type I secretion periplasmic adaptor subunit [Pseudomonas sp. PIA16]